MRGNRRQRPANQSETIGVARAWAGRKYHEKRRSPYARIADRGIFGACMLKRVNQSVRCETRSVRRGVNTALRLAVQRPSSCANSF